MQPISAAGDTAAQGFGSRFAAGISRVAGSAARVLENTMAAAAVAAGGLASAALVGGWRRITTIEDATASLTVTLGSAESAAEVLAGVLETVRGTPFNLDQFARAAQVMAGMGIEADKIPGFLEAIGEASSLQGGRANEFADRLSFIFGQIAAQGRIMGDDIRQIQQTGVPALAILANAFGVTTEEMRDMVSKGAVPAGEALDALAEGILRGSDGPAGATQALAGNMEALRETLSGSAGGFRSALDRLGAAFLEPFRPAIIAGFNAATDAIDRMAEVAGDFGERVVNTEWFARFTGWLETLPSTLGNVAPRLSEFSSLLGGVAGALGGFALKGLGRLPLVGGLIPGIGPVAGAIAGLVASSPKLRESLGGLFEAFGNLGETIGEKLLPRLEPVLRFVETLLSGGLDALATGVGYVSTLVDLFAAGGIGAVWDRVYEDWSDAWDNSIKPALDEWSTSVGETFSSEESQQSFREGLDTLGANFQPWVEETRTGLETDIADKWPTAIGNGLQTTAATLTEALAGAVNALGNWISENGAATIELFGKWIGWALVEGWRWTLTIGLGLYNALMEGLWGIARGVASKAGLVYDAAVHLGRTIADAMNEGLENTFGKDLGQFMQVGLRGVPVVGGFYGLASDLFRASGGPVGGGRGHIVGESGAEWFQPSSAGWIFNAEQVARMAAAVGVSGADGGPMLVIENVNTSHDPEAIARAAFREVRKRAVYAGGR